MRDLTQGDDWKTQDGIMIKKMLQKTGMHSTSCALFLHHSALLSLPAVLLNKVPNTSRTTAMILIIISAVLSMNRRTLSLVTSQPKMSSTPFKSVFCSPVDQSGYRYTMIAMTSVECRFILNHAFSLQGSTLTFLTFCCFGTY